MSTHKRTLSAEAAQICHFLRRAGRGRRRRSRGLGITRLTRVTVAVGSDKRPARAVTAAPTPTALLAPRLAATALPHQLMPYLITFSYL
ncbi:hypothetical protein RR46_06153 [Papilio xuthus]|uniref:Uncharacterized protein n=1 Tax=Papilio xuthus TaxID=66420 RepID=A0A194QDE9_PAPXU|nr:hypothetical protein RR46_06153 [Papilio xuthus]